MNKLTGYRLLGYLCKIYPRNYQPGVGRNFSADTKPACEIKSSKAPAPLPIYTVKTWQPAYPPFPDCIPIRPPPETPLAQRLFGIAIKMSILLSVLYWTYKEAIWGETHETVQSYNKWLEILKPKEPEEPGKGGKKGKGGDGGKKTNKNDKNDKNDKNAKAKKDVKTEKATKDTKKDVKQGANAQASCVSYEGLFKKFEHIMYMKKEALFASTSIYRTKDSGKSIEINVLDGSLRI